MGSHGNRLAGYLIGPNRQRFQAWGFCLFAATGETYRVLCPEPLRGKLFLRQYYCQQTSDCLPTLVGVTSLIFLAMRVIPGDDPQTIYSESAGV